MLNNLIASGKRYRVILADPPWKYNSRANHKTRFRGGACGHYPLMSFDEIAALPVKDYAADSAVLFLWATFPFLEKQLTIFNAWGFKYKTVGFTWIKTNSRNGQPFFGVGYYTKSNAEVCLLGTRGPVIKPKVNTVSSVIICPRREHSRKPEEVYERIEALYDGPRLEMFARSQRPGWDAWGNEVDKFGDPKGQALPLGK